MVAELAASAPEGTPNLLTVPACPPRRRWSAVGEGAPASPAERQRRLGTTAVTRAVLDRRHPSRRRPRATAGDAVPRRADRLQRTGRRRHGGLADADRRVRRSQRADPLRQPVLRPISFGTTARSAVLTDWPDGGFVGVHGTDSRGCCRVASHTVASASATATSCDLKRCCRSARHSRSDESPTRQRPSARRRDRRVGRGSVRASRYGKDAEASAVPALEPDPASRGQRHKRERRRKRQRPRALPRNPGRRARGLDPQTRRPPRPCCSSRWCWRRWPRPGSSS